MCYSDEIGGFFFRPHCITVRAPELDLLTLVAGKCLWSAFVVSGSSSGGGCRISLFGFLPWILLFGFLRGLPSCVVCSRRFISLLLM